MKKVKALVLMSGGLDSMLAAKVLMEQGIEVKALTFVSSFFNAEQSRESAKKIGVELIEYDFMKDHLEMVKKPKHGYGKNMNPCIDCHGLMVRKSLELMKKEGFDFIATGEVLGQRPKSQNKSALNLVEKYGEYEGFLLRPLSAKLLPETRMEKEGLVNREKLFDIQGRNRERQFALAKKYDIKEYPAPGGGCILTYSEYSNKLRVLLEKWPDANNNDVDFLRAGRVFWADDIMIVVGRNSEDNEKIEKLANDKDLIFDLELETGPLVLVRDKRNTKFKKFVKIELDIPKEMDLDKYPENKDAVIEKAAMMTGYFATKVRGQKISVILK
ncbi:tRNA 4-thiouridine(8) synthase ThiI [Candidatus Parcubacteria bacterium]|nr:MAG: tRNA 4-thiouridine(8) synthase ThiI [Candidatus Parcubacteria bacterium]